MNDATAFITGLKLLGAGLAMIGAIGAGIGVGLAAMGGVQAGLPELNLYRQRTIRRKTNL